jgi:glycosyltransferase involved in cell wall biosynthesis
VINIPFLISARGTDINLISEYPLPKKMILWAANLASGSITVSQALKDKMTEIGADQDKIHVLRNGIDLDLFKILNKEECKKKYGVRQKVLLSVGNLIELKGHHLIIEAMQQLEGFQLIIVGKGDREKKLKLLVNKLNLNDRVTFLGEKKQSELVEIYNASDAFILASSREGMANVLLESIACGTPVIATDVGGASEVVKQKEAGILINRSVEEVVQGVRVLFDDYPKSKETRNYAEQFSWDSTVEGLEKLFEKSVL